MLAALTAAAPAKAWWFGRQGPDPYKKTAAAYESGRYAEVIQDLSSDSLQLVSPRHLARAYEYLAESYARTGRLTDALGTYQLGVKLFPKDARLLAGFGELLHQAGLNEQAKPLFDEALALNPNNPQANLGVAEIDAALGFYRRGRTHYFKALETMNNNPAVWAEYAEVLWRLKDYPTAEDAAQESLSLSSSTQTEVLLAFIQRSDGRLRQALGTLGRAAAQSPERTDIALARALWMMEARQWNKSLAVDQAVLDQFPQNPLGLWIRASILLQKGRRREATADLTAAAQAQEESPFVAAVAAKMLARLGTPAAQ
ncbi:MAG TPA: tetratricopeptide repeat protein [Elusimicrobiota bacterium]|nr:tetratricopeptide repeat protein [Elusimicrobiota bacterium]